MAKLAILNCIKGGGYLSRLLEKLIVFETISICFQSILEYISGESIRRIIFKDLRSIIFYPYGAMWYIQALIIALIIITVLINNKKELSALPFAFFFYGVLLICNRYFFLVEGTPLEILIKKVLYYTFSLRNGFTVGFLFTLIGVLIAKNYSSIQNLFNINISKLILLLFGCFLLLILEFSFTDGRLMVDDKGMYVSFILIIPILFALNLKNDWNRRIRSPDNYIILRNISTTLYLIHSPNILIIKIAEKLFFGNKVVFGSIWIIEFLVESVIICCTIFIIYKCKRLRFYRICT